MSSQPDSIQVSSQDIKRSLSTVYLATMLVTLHYGGAFLIGTGEKALNQGIAGSLYAVSTSLGILAIVIVAKFYWNAKYPIWDLLGERYDLPGERNRAGVRTIIGVLSWTWMIGVVAAQILGGVSLMSVLGISFWLSIVILTVVIVVLSLVSLDKVKYLFLTLLAISTLALAYSLIKMDGASNYGFALIDFIPSLNQLDTGTLIGIPLTTILLTAIGMDFHQFVVQAKDVKTSYMGCVLAALVLYLLALLPSAVVTTALHNQVIAPTINGKEAIPLILAWAGGGSHNPFGFFLGLSLLVAVIGSGSGLLRIMNRTLFDFTSIPNSDKNKVGVVVANIILVLIIVATGEKIIDLVIAFYAVYVAGVLFPFIAFVLEKAGFIKISGKTIRWSLIMGTISSAVLLILNQAGVRVAFLGNSELAILLVGFVFSLTSLIVGRILASN